MRYQALLQLPPRGERCDTKPPSSSPQGGRDAIPREYLTCSDSWRRARGEPEEGLQIHHGLVAFIKQQVENAEVRLEAKLLLVDLVVRLGLEVSIGQWMLRTDDFTVISPLYAIISDSIGRNSNGLSRIRSGGIGQFDVLVGSSQRRMENCHLFSKNGRRSSA